VNELKRTFTALLSESIDFVYIGKTVVEGRSDGIDTRTISEGIADPNENDGSGLIRASYCAERAQVGCRPKVIEELVDADTVKSAGRRVVQGGTESLRTVHLLI
jgi:hypothetical protein